MAITSCLRDCREKIPQGESECKFRKKPNTPAVRGDGSLPTFCICTLHSVVQLGGVATGFGCLRRAILLYLNLDGQSRERRLDSKVGVDRFSPT